MTAMTLSFAVSSVILRASRCQGKPRAVTHDMAHSFDVVDALPVKTDEESESHRAPARHRLFR